MYTLLQPFEFMYLYFLNIVLLETDYMSKNLNIHNMDETPDLLPHYM